LRQFGVLESEILDARPSPRFTKMMEFQYRRARDYYQAAQKALPPEDRKNIVASEIMAAIYSRILEKLKREQFPVFTKRCRLNNIHKVWILGSHLIKARFGR
jgi:phytoene synthase